MGQHSPVTVTRSQEVWISLFAGAMAGALAKTSIAPLDRTKIIFQISNTPYTAKGAWIFMRNTYIKEGFFSLWRGNSATMARIVPYAAIQFTSHEQWKNLFGVDKDDGKKSSPALRFLAGSLAGVTSQSLTYPLDLARARMAVTHKHQYRSLKEVFVKITRDEGITSFYRGYVATILGVIPYAGTSFFTYGTLKNWFTEKNLLPNPIMNLLCGGIAGMVGQSTSYPLDIIRRRMQTSAVKGTDEHYKTITSTVISIYREEGFRVGFFKGLSMNWIKGPIAVGISFATYDFTRDTLRLLV
uniref:Solute carrier family 25 member 42 n=1 Tax=Clastoptera arizonana TaxID=38151 RepID=A0A1B6DIH9_9HEMI